MSKIYTQIEYGINCDLQDEKQLVKNINGFLETKHGYRKMYKASSKSLLQARLPFEYKYYYYQFIKDRPRWYFELYPNIDINGKTKFDEHQKTNWLLYVNKPFFAENSQEQTKELELFLNGLLSTIGYETIILHQYTDDDERL